MLLVQHPAPWSPWSPWSTLIHLGPQIPECGYTKWSKQDQGGPGVVQGHRQDHGAGWWTRSVQDHCGPLKNFFLMLYRREAGVEPNNLQQTELEYVQPLWRNQPSSRILPGYYLCHLFTESSEILSFDATGTYLIPA